MLITSTRTMIPIILSLVAAPHREVSFRRRCSLSLLALPGGKPLLLCCVAQS